MGSVDTSLSHQRLAPLAVTQLRALAGLSSVQQPHFAEQYVPQTWQPLEGCPMQQPSDTRELLGATLVTRRSGAKRERFDRLSS